MKSLDNNNAATKKSALLYDTDFKCAYLKPVFWMTWLAIFFQFILLFMPAIIHEQFAKILGSLAYKSNKKRRNIAATNLGLCFPGQTEETLQNTIENNFRHQARSVLHYGLIWWAPRFWLNRRIRVNGEEHIRNSLDNQRSVIIMAAHSYGLEAAVSATSMRYPVSGPFNPMKNKLIDWFVAKGRARFGTHIYMRESGLRPIIKDVRAGSVMFYLPDEDLGLDRSIFCNFFGVKKATVPVLGRLAKSCNADVIPCIACYDLEKHQYVVHYLPKLDNFPVGDDEQDSQLMNDELEKLIKICPEQYFWTMKLFKTRPQGESAFYQQQHKDG